jgi:hypothetical protein
VLRRSHSPLKRGQVLGRYGDSETIDHQRLHLCQLVSSLVLNQKVFLGYLIGIPHKG